MKKDLGSFEWANTTQGKLSFKEKLNFVHHVMLPSTVGFLKTQLKLEKPRHEIDLAQISIPDTAMVKMAIEALDSQSNSMLINHSWRSYLWGAGLACIQGKSYDEEVLLTSALYHDIGLTDQHLHDTDCRCFTLKSALAFEQDAKKIDYPADKLNLIKDAICMHMNGYSDESNPIEVTLLQYGVSCDVIGNRFFTLPQNFRDGVLERYPRAQFNRDFQQCLKQAAQAQPNGRTAVLNLMGLPLMIKLNPFQD